MKWWINTKRSKAINMKKCKAFIRHGPGHQSKEHCCKTGPHKIHEAYYGCYGEYARWIGKETITGFFDEPPDFDKKLTESE